MEEYTVAREDFACYLDMEDAMRRLGGNKTIFMMLLRKFLNSNSDVAIREALAGGSIQDAAAAAHTLKGLAANLSMTSLRDDAASLEQALKNGEKPGNLPEKVYETWGKTVYVVNAAISE